MRCLGLAAEHYESGERLGRAVLNHRCYNCVPYRGQGQKVRFDVAKFDAVTSDIDVRIQPALTKKKGEKRPPRLASWIRAPTLMAKKDGCRKIGTSKIAG